MRILDSIEALAEVKNPVVLAAGVFDGMHLGHQAVLKEALKEADQINATAVALTFDPHPATILRPDSAPRMLTSREFKLHLMARLGFTHALVVNFTPRFASLEAVDFVAELCKAASPLAGICIGEGWHFGRGRLGDAALLRKLGAEYGFFTKEVPHVRSNGDVVSSTLIRQTIANGDMQKASRLLGRPFAIPGIVQRGAGIGHQLGFPTANLATGHEQYPPDGVYAVGVTVDGEHHRGVANIGIRPTVTKSLNRVLEVHLFNFSGDLYGSEIEVALLHFLRPEIKFENIAALRTQIELDVAAAHDWHWQQDKPA